MKAKSANSSPLFPRTRRKSDAEDLSLDVVSPTPSRTPISARFRRRDSGAGLEEGGDPLLDARTSSSPSLSASGRMVRIESVASESEGDNSPVNSPRRQIPRSNSSNVSLASIVASPRIATRRQMLLQVPPDQLALLVDDIRSACLSLTKRTNVVDKQALMDLVAKIDRVDNYMSSSVALNDKDVCIKLMHYASEKNMHDLVSFWLMVAEFERNDPGIHGRVAQHIMEKYIESGVLEGVVSRDKLMALQKAFDPKETPPLDFFEDLKREVEDLIEAQLMPGFQMQQRAELSMSSQKLQSSPLPSKPGSLRHGKVSRQGSTPRDSSSSGSASSDSHTINTLRIEVNDMKEQAEAWKTSYLNAKEQLVKSEKGLQKLLESYRKDEAEIVRLKKELRDARSRKSNMKGSPVKVRSNTGGEDKKITSPMLGRPMPSPPSSTGGGAAISRPAGVKVTDDSTPLLLGEIDKHALMRIRKPCDFEPLAVLGKGNFGVVFLATETRAKRTLAVKRMNKNTIIDRNQVLTIMTEALVMKEAAIEQSPWLVQLHYAFDDGLFLYLAMDFCHGSDLRSVLENVELDEPSVRFFAAEMIQAVHALHSRGFCHRDLPENFLLFRTGHIKLADFGLSKAGYELDQAAEATAKKKKIVAQAMRVFVESSENKSMTHQTIIVNATTLVGDVINMTLEKMHGVDANKEWVLYEEGTSAASTFSKELDPITPVSEVTKEWSETRSDLPGADVRFKLVLRERVQLRDFARRKKNLRRARKTMHINRGAIRDPYYKPPQLSKREKLYSVVGTPSYMAREILEGQGYEAVCDFWSIGCIIYEMLVGELPFSGSSPEELFQAVLNSDECLVFPETVSPAARDIVVRFLSPPKERLGYNGIEEIHKHEFFSFIDWPNLHKSTPPFVPEIESDTDLSYFEEASTKDVPKTLDEPVTGEDVTALVYDPFKKDWPFSIRN